MKDNKQASRATELLISSGKSNRLDVILNKSKASIKQDKLQTINSTQCLAKDLNPQIKMALSQASQLIDEKLGYIMKSYPAGKKSSFFKLKYGIELAKIKIMAIEESFNLLSLNKSKVQYFKLIKTLDYNGNNID